MKHIFILQSDFENYKWSENFSEVQRCLWIPAKECYTVVLHVSQSIAEHKSNRCYGVTISENRDEKMVNHK